MVVVRSIAGCIGHLECRIVAIELNSMLDAAAIIKLFQLKGCSRYAGLIGHFHRLRSTCSLSNLATLGLEPLQKHSQIFEIIIY